MSVVVAGEGPAGNLVYDLDGVVYLGDRLIPGVTGAMLRLERSGYHSLFCTNNSTRGPAEVAAKIRSVTGYPARPGQVLTSGQAAAMVLAGPSPRCLVVGGNGIIDALHQSDIPITEDWRKAEAVVVGLTTSLTYEILRDAAAAVRNGARLVASNRDATIPTPDGLWPGAGAIVAAIETASGTAAEVVGKPFEPMRELIRSRLGSGEVWVIGDRPETDVAMAASEPGWRSALILSGVTSSADGIEPSPDLVANDLADFADQLIGNRR